MDQAAILHMPDSNYCFPVAKDRLVLRLRVLRKDEFVSVAVLYSAKFSLDRGERLQPMAREYEDELFAYYETTLSLDDTRVEYAFRLEGKGQPPVFYSEEGFSSSFDLKRDHFSAFQLPFINQADVIKVPSWVPKARFYQIFVDRFYKGKKDKDQSYVNMAWGDRPTYHGFAGGDLDGIRAKLDYLEDLGINALYLTPIFKSPTNHKYDIVDYYQVDPQFGTNEELRSLVREAHQKGIKIVLDGVFNHCSEQNPIFQDVERRGRESPYHDWFMVHGDKADPKARNYETFAFATNMPKLNTNNPEVQKYICDIGAHYVSAYDIDGWRLDVSDEVSHSLWRKFREAVKDLKPDAIIFGENWHNAYPFLLGDQFDSVMNYSFTKATIDYLTRPLSAQAIAAKLNGLLIRDKWPVDLMMLNLLDSHDTPRLLRQLNGDKDKMLLGLALLYMYPGMPCIYYGTELAMDGGQDPDCRRCFPWEEVGERTPFNLTLRKLIKLKDLAPVQDGKALIRAEGALLSLARIKDGQEVVLLANMSDRPQAFLSQGQELVVNLANGNSIAPKGFVIFGKKAALP